jgi:hypothetical protein
MFSLRVAWQMIPTMSSLSVLTSLPAYCHLATGPPTGHSMAMVMVLSMWAALSDERRVCHLPRSKSEIYVIYIYNFTCRHSTESVVKSSVPCGYLLFTRTVLHITLVYM